MFGKALDLPVPDVDKQCRLLGPTALVVQALMGIMVITSLLYKRYREKPQRAWRIWIFDVSKQVVGQAILHGSNVLVSASGARQSLRNPCVTYFLNILIDTTAGVAIIYALLHLFTHILTTKIHFPGFESGVYGDPPSFKWWLQQATVYVVVLLIMKTTVILALNLFPWLTEMGKWLLSWTGNRNAVQVIFVMGVFPVTMNVLQFWIIDSIVKFKNITTKDEAFDSEATPADREPLVLGGDASDSDGESDLEAGTRAKVLSQNASSSIGRRRPSPGRVDAPRIPGALSNDTLNIDPIILPSSSGSQTIRRRSPPPSPSLTSSYGSLGSDGDAGQTNDSWSRASDGMAGDSRKCGPSAERSVSPADDTKRREAWNMPVRSHPPGRARSEPP